MLALLPFILAICIFGFWFAFKIIKKKSQTIVGKVITTLVIVLFLAHPNIVQYMFSNFNCVNIDNDERVLDDLEILCWNKDHSFFSLAVAFPSIVVWGLGIPLFAFILL